MGENYESSSSVEISSEISSEFEMGEVSENIEIGNEISESEESYDDYSDCVEESTEDEGDRRCRSQRKLMMITVTAWKRRRKPELT
ncbi:MAG: hypothetical protein ACLSFZ_06370 [Frisingicoccus sp.]